jgi:hypothetical protein
MEPSTEQQSNIASKVHQPPPPYQLQKAPRQPTEHEIFMREIQAIFLKQSHEIERRLEAHSKIDRRFDMNAILFDDERMRSVTFADLNPEKKND